MQNPSIVDALQKSQVRNVPANKKLPTTGC